MKALLIIICLYHFVVFAQKPNVAILPLESQVISPQEALTLTEKLRTEIIKRGNMRVLERGQMEAILQEQGFQQTGCTTNDCAVEMGQLIGVDVMVAGTIGKVGKVFLISVRLIDVEKGDILKMADEEIAGEIEDLLILGIPTVAARLSDTLPQPPLLESTEPLKSTIAPPDENLKNIVALSPSGLLIQLFSPATVHFGYYERMLSNNVAISLQGFILDVEWLGAGNGYDWEVSGEGSGAGIGLLYYFNGAGQMSGFFSGLYVQRVFIDWTYEEWDANDPTRNTDYYTEDGSGGLFLFSTVSYKWIFARHYILDTGILFGATFLRAPGFIIVPLISLGYAF
ncbi:MAG: penicillin-binding protein activator LpoB [Fibrobacterales bacterium]